MNIKYFVITAALVAGVQSLFAQQTISLEQSRKAALAYSTAIKNGQLNINSAEAGIISARSNHLPSVSGTGVALHSFKDLVQPIPGVLDKGINNLYLFGLTASQAVYSGGKILTGEQLASLQLEASNIRARQSVDSVLLLTEQKYWNIVNLQEQTRTIKANEALLRNLLKMQQDMLASGLIARNDLLKVKVQLSQLLVNKSSLNNSRMLALYDFCAYTGMQFDSTMVMEDSFEKEPLMSSQEASPDTSLTHVENYQLLALQVRNSSLQSRLTQADNLPSLSVGLSASQVGSFNGAFKSTFTPMAFGTLSIPISENIWGGNRQKVKQRKLNEQIAQNNLTDGRNQLKVGILKSWYDMKDALTQISYAKDNLTQATENLKVNQDNYKAGLSTVTDVLDAQASYQQAAVTLNTSFTNLQIKNASYRFATGTINKM
ncbi:TolC family protein [Mucilaginibacter sp. RS28]|uniref:TolC family protein n=1 Tax=Mucilaginibacter straminoryzae TaxID=2932774 RepID=A0A9X1X0Z3_9SPHI|nr:TolC family protein [Mucilaginibacter straminoryzae]MCJ8208385.1 TolC family protein [Mucilaginibacter straminoryzae]